MYRTTKTLALASAFAATILAAGANSPAAAATSVRVSYRDLDLATSDAQTKLTKRLRQASARVCDPIARVMLSETMACRSEAIGRARADLSAALGGARPVALH